MKKLITAIVLFCCIYNCAAQTDTVKKVDTTVIDPNQKESRFPGGERAWINFLQENLEYPSKAKRKNIQGTVVVQFIVNTDGSISDIQAISGPEELRQAAVNTVKKSPNWVPAFQFGKKVRSYKKQPINYSIQTK
jgi:protein TonB